MGQTQAQGKVRRPCEPSLGARSVVIAVMMIVLMASLMFGVAPRMPPAGVPVVAILDMGGRNIANLGSRVIDPGGRGVRRALRHLLPDNGTDSTTDTAADDGTVAPAHGVADDGAGNGTDTAPNGRAEHVGTRGRRGEEQHRGERKK